MRLLMGGESVVTGVVFANKYTRKIKDESCVILYVVAVFVVRDYFVFFKHL